MAKKLLITLLISFAATAASAAGVPKYLNYQAVLFDDGGNPLQDGAANIYIRILDANQKVVYEEVQNVDVISGVVSLIIGDGLDPSTGRPTGGVDSSILSPSGPKYLEVEAEGYPPENLMEFVSVPYAVYSDIAMGVADGSIGASSISGGSIRAEHFSDDVISWLTERIVGSGENTAIIVREEFEKYKNFMSGLGGAAGVGIFPDFTYSSASNVRDVLKDMDIAIKKREEDVVWAKKDYAAKIAAEESARKSVDTTLQKNIDTEAANRTTADGILQTNINSEATARQNADAALQTSINAHASSKNNPHSVTTTQIGAVAVNDLYENGLVKDSKIPQTIARKSDIPIPPDLNPIPLVKGRIVNRVLDNGYTSPACNVGIVLDTSMRASVVCKLDENANSSSCTMRRVIVPEFSVSSDCGLRSLTTPSRGIFYDFDHTLVRHFWNTTHYCDEIISFNIELPTCVGMDNRSDIRWAIYEVVF